MTSNEPQAQSYTLLNSHVRKNEEYQNHETPLEGPSLGGGNSGEGGLRVKEQTGRIRLKAATRYGPAIQQGTMSMPVSKTTTKGQDLHGVFQFPLPAPRESY